MKKIKAEIHTPEELLKGASFYLESTDAQMMRAVVLEAFTALETFVYKRVFELLENKLDGLLVKWLRDKTRNRLDDRLEILTPIALGKEPIDKTSALWRNYKEAQQIRNNVTHKGSRVSREEAKKVVNTVYKWLAYLGSTVEVELNFLRLKEYLEKNRLKFTKEHEIETSIVNFFKEKEGGSHKSQVRLPNGKMADLILKFGDIEVLVEIKTLLDGKILKSEKGSYLYQVSELLKEAKIARAALIVIFKESIPEIFREKVLTYYDGTISVVGIDMT